MTSCSENSRRPAQQQTHTDDGNKHTDDGNKHTDDGNKHTDEGNKHTDEGNKHTDEGNKHTLMKETLSSDDMMSESSPCSCSAEVRHHVYFYF